jgi:predicted GNAT family acetyltransferase
MSLVHPLDRPVWSALTGRWAGLTLVEGAARRLAPDFGLFAAAPDTTSASLADLGALVRMHGEVGLMEPDPWPAPPGTTATTLPCWQMAAQAPPPAAQSDFAILPLGEADAAEMLGLATITRPGPFFSRTHQLGPFIGVKVDGRLVAMAGERIRAEGFGEISGVCTHPDHRGRGYAAALMTRVAERIFARGETPVLHTLADNAGAIALYERLGFAFRREMTFTVLVPA